MLVGDRKPWYAVVLNEAVSGVGTVRGARRGPARCQK